MAQLPTGTYIEATEAITWIAFGECINSASLWQSYLNAIARDSAAWGNVPTGDLLPYLEHVVEGKNWSAKVRDADGSVLIARDKRRWSARLKQLQAQHKTDAAGVLQKLRAYLAEREERSKRLDVATKEFIEACRSKRPTLYGASVPCGEKLRGDADVDEVPNGYLRRPHIQITPHHNTLTFDWEAPPGDRAWWDRNYVGLQVKTSEVRERWPSGGGLERCASQQPPTIDATPISAEAESATPAKKTRARRPDANEHIRRNRILTVRRAAEKYDGKLGPYAIAQALVCGQPGGKFEGYRLETIQQIIAGTYPSAKKLGIVGPVFPPLSIVTDNTGRASNTGGKPR